jgi:hypothetical protein
MKNTNRYLRLITTQVNSLNYDQLDLLFSVYLQLNIQFEFFMPTEKHIEFMNYFLETSSKYHIDTYKSLITLLTTSYSYESRYPLVLYAIDMIKKDYSLHTIINVLYRNR